MFTITPRLPMDYHNQLSGRNFPVGKFVVETVTDVVAEPEVGRWSAALPVVFSRWVRRGIKKAIGQRIKKRSHIVAGLITDLMYQPDVRDYVLRLYVIDLVSVKCSLHLACCIWEFEIVCSLHIFQHQVCRIVDVVDVPLCTMAAHVSDSSIAKQTYFYN